MFTPATCKDRVSPTRRWIAASAITVAIYATGSAALADVPVYRLQFLGTTDSAMSMVAHINPSGQVAFNLRVQAEDGGVPVDRPALWDGQKTIDLGTLGGNWCGVAGINRDGHVTGYCDTANTSFLGTQINGFVSDGEHLHSLGTLGGTHSTPRGINDSGLITGHSYLPADTGGAAFIWDGSEMRALSGMPAGNSGASAINASGHVAGNYALHQAFFWDGSVAYDLGSLGGGRTSATHINDQAQVAGTSATGEPDVSRAFVWSNHVMQDLGSLGGKTSYTHDLNDLGQVTGYSHLADVSQFHAFLWDGFQLLDLGTLAGPYSMGNAINNKAQVIGWSRKEGSPYIAHAFLWDNNTLHDLNDLIDANDPLKAYVTLTNAVAINDAGQIVVNGYDSRSTNWEQSVYLASPADSQRLLEELVTNVIGVGPGRSLLAKIYAAQAYFEADDIQATCETLKDFVLQTQALAGKRISPETADSLVTDAALICKMISCN